MNLFTLPPTLIKRAIEDLGAIGDAARRLPQIETQLLAYVDKLTTEIVAMRTAVEPLNDQLTALREEMEPIRELSKVREGIEPLDEDMRSVRESVDELEPLIKQMSGRLAGLDKRLEGIQADIAPIGDLADKIPGVGR